MNYQKAEFELSAGTVRDLPRPSLPEIVFSGRSNVGKSSLINKLLNRRALARVSSSPGKTSTINFYRVDACRFVDLPGYGYARVSQSEKLRWAALVEGYLSAKRPIGLVLQLVDMRRSPTPDDLSMLEYLVSEKLPFAVVATKADKLNKSETQAQLESFDGLFTDRGIRFYPFSAVNGLGADRLKALIEASISERKADF